MKLQRERGAAIFDYRALELAHMGVPHCRGAAAVGNDAGEVELLDGAFAQHPFEPRDVERRIGDLLDGDVGGDKLIDELLGPGAGGEIALAEKRPQRL